MRTLHQVKLMAASAVLVLSLGAGLWASHPAYADSAEPRVTAKKDIETKSDETANAKSTVSVQTVKLKSVSNTASGVKLKWPKSSGANGYIVLRAYPEDDYYTRIKYIYSGSTLSYTDTSASSGTRYCYSVRAFRQIGDTMYLAGYDSYGTYIYRLARPKVTKVSNTSTGVKVQWSQASGAAGYYVLRKNGSGSYKRIKTIKSGSTTSCVDKTAVNGVTYTYTVRAYKGNSKSAYVAAGKSIRRSSSSSGNTNTNTGNTVKYRALLIGMSAYNPYTFNLSNPSSDRNSNNLYGTYYDVRAMKTMLSGMTYSKITMKENLSASQAISAISSAFAGADSNDVSLFYYTGHGFTDTGTYSGALAMRTSSYNIEALLLSRLATALKKVPGKVVVLFDSCGSGAAIASKGAGTFDAATFNDEVMDAFFGMNGPVTAKYNELRSGKFYVIASSKPHESSYDLGFGSAFTAGIVQGAGYRHQSSAYAGYLPADSNSNKVITLEEAYSYAYRYLNNNGYGSKQHVLRYPTGSGQAIYKKK